MTNIFKALRLARTKFLPIIKNESNTFFKNKYADLGTVLAAVTDALTECGLIMIQRVDMTPDGQPYLSTAIVHAESGETIESRYPLLPGKPNDPQALGGAITYARRYAALTILGAAPEDDDGETAVGRGKAQQKTQKEQKQTERLQFIAQSPTMLAALKEKCAAVGVTSKDIVAHFNGEFETFHDIPVSHYKGIMDWLDTFPVVQGEAPAEEPKKTSGRARK